MKPIAKFSLLGEEYSKRSSEGQDKLGRWLQLNKKREKSESWKEMVYAFEARGKPGKFNAMKANATGNLKVGLSVCHDFILF